MKKIFFLPFLILILLSSCQKQIDTKPNINRLLKDSSYVRENLVLRWNDSMQEKVELYISKAKDTIYNQYRIIENGEIDSLNSLFYSLDIRKSDIAGFYNAQISIHSEYENLKLDQQNKRVVTFYFLEQNATKVYDSISSVSTDISTTLEFKFENQYDDRLIGMLSQTVYRDTIANGEKAVNYRQSNLLVDNYRITDNIFLEAYEFNKENKFNPQQIKLDVEK